jgi:glycosyltransferase involved in cell wall biosynthesis
MKICFFIYNISNAGGSERVTTLIANGLKERGYNVSILSICGTNSFYDLNEKIPIEIMYKNKNNINSKYKYLDIMKKAYNYHKFNKTDLVIDVFASRSIISIPLKLLLNLKNISWEHFNYSAKIGLNSIGRKLACRYSNQIITLTNEDVLLYKENNRNIKAKINYIYNPNPYKNSIISNLNNKNIITVGRLSYQKGYDMLLEAWHFIEKECDYKLIIVGDGEEKDKLKLKAKNLNLKNVDFVGITNNVDELYKQSSIYVSSSRFEGLPMCMIEAQSFGLPIVSFKCKTGPSEIVKDGHSGYLVDMYDYELLAKKILILIKDKEKLKRMSQIAKIESQRFDTNVIINKWEEIIKSI